MRAHTGFFLSQLASADAGGPRPHSYVPSIAPRYPTISPSQGQVPSFRHRAPVAHATSLPLPSRDLSYADMNVAKGCMAMDAYHEMCASRDAADVGRNRAALRGYCKRDTLAMVRIVEALRRKVGESPR